MKKNLFKKLAITTAQTVLSFALLHVQAAQATTLYSITDLGSFVNYPNYPNFTIGTKINDVGQVIVESYQNNKLPTQQFFLWSKGNLTDLTGFNHLGINGIPSLGGYVSDINNTGQLVGSWGEIGGKLHALLGNQNTITDLGSFNGITGDNLANGINDLGQVVGVTTITKEIGQSQSITQYFGWLWENGIKTGLNSPNNPSFYPLKINNLGQILGLSYGQPFDNFRPDAVILTPNKVIKLPVLNPNDINNIGQVVGSSEKEAVLWSDSHVFGLGFLGSGSNVNTYSVARSINDLGQVVGLSTISQISPLTHAFLWDGQLEDINNLIASDSGWELTDALDINNKGQIVGIGRLNGQSKAYLLTPLSAPVSVPEPRTLMGLFTFAGFAVALRCKQKQQQKDTTKA